MATLDLSFQLNERGQYEATFTATGVFNLHVERPINGDCHFKQTTVEGGHYCNTKYASVIGEDDFEREFSAEIFPKYIKVISTVPVTSARVTFA